MSIAEKLTTITENTQKVYQAGQELINTEVAKGNDDLEAILFGNSSDSKSYYDIFWDAYQQNGALTTYSYMFAGRGWTDETFKPKYSLSDIAFTGASYMFAYSRVENIEYDLDFSNVNTISYLFAYNTVLKRIKSVRFKTNTSNTSYPFTSCDSLEDITIKGNIGFSITFQSCPLSADSIRSVVASLSDTASGLTLTLDKKAVNNAFTTEEWESIVATKPNWTIGLV